MTEPKKMYAESVEEQFGNWCEVKRTKEANIEYISVKHLKEWIAKNSELTLEGKRLSSHELLKFIEE